MPKFKKGETSSTVIETKDSITKSIIDKSKLIDKILSYENIPNSLNIKSSTISLMSVHKWSDIKLGIISYSYNTSKKDHNKQALEMLKKSINSANKRLLSTTKTIKDYNGESTTRLSKNEVNQLKNENEELRTALAEIYRAYMQLLGKCREDEQIDDAYRKLILTQAKVLGRNKMWRVN